MYGKGGFRFGRDTDRTKPNRHPTEWDPRRRPSCARGGGCNLQASNKPKSTGGAYSGIPHPYLRRWATAIHGYLGVPGSRMPVQPPDTRTSGSLPRARPRFDKSASRTACETTCESYITLNPRVIMRHAHSSSCSMAARRSRCAVRSRAALERARVLRLGMRGLRGPIEACRASQLDGQRPAALLSTSCKSTAMRLAASC